MNEKQEKQMSDNGPRRVDGIALSVLRIVVGIVFVVHGFGKLMTGFGTVSESFAEMGIPLPLVSAIMVALAEVVGGLALAAGFYTRLATVPLIVTMLVAMIMVHLRNGFFIYNSGYEYTLVLLVVLVVIAVTGPGAIAVDNLLGKKPKEKSE